YGLQTASANLRRIDFEHRHKPDVIIDPRTVSENGVGEEAWYPEDFEEEEEDSADSEVQARPQPESPSPAKVATPDAARKPSGTESNQSDECKELERVQAALPGAEHGNLRDLKTVFEFAGIYPPKADVSSASDFEA